MSKNSNCEYFDLGNILRMFPRKNHRSNENKISRELWCAAQALKHLSLTDYLLYSYPEEASPIDVVAISSAKNEHNIQVVEIAPRSKISKECFKDVLGGGYSTLEKETFKLLQYVVHEKEIKYRDIDKKNLNLLIYLNSPTYDNSNYTIIFDEELDFDFPKIQAFFSLSGFGAIILLACEKATFLKNTELA